MSLNDRVRKLAARLADPEAERLRRHWARRFRERVAVFERLAAGVPDSHQGPVGDAIAPWAERLFDPQDTLYDETPDGLRQTAPAVVRWFQVTMDGFNAATPEPVPAELLDALLGYPAASLWEGGCDREAGGCGVRLPGRGSRALGPDPADPRHNLYTYGRPYFAACPCCGAAVPSRRHPMAAGFRDDPDDPDDPIRLTPERCKWPPGAAGLPTPTED